MDCVFYPLRRNFFDEKLCGAVFTPVYTTGVLGSVKIPKKIKFGATKIPLTPHVRTGSMASSSTIDSGVKDMAIAGVYCFP